MKKFIFTLLAAALTVLGANAMAQTNSGGGNQGATGIKPRIEAIERKITEYRTDTIEQINLWLEEGDVGLDDIRRALQTRIEQLVATINAYNKPGNEVDPFVTDFADSRDVGQCLSCTGNQKMAFDGGSWRCLSATLPTCATPGQVFNTTNCQCENPCPDLVDSTTGRVLAQFPDTNGACCPQALMSASNLCQTCPPGSGLNFQDGLCRCFQGGNIVYPGGSCGPGCSAPNALDNNNVCCPANTIVNGVCGGNACPADRLIPAVPVTQYSGQCCPAGTTANSGLCLCGNGTYINPGQSCSSCPSGQDRDANGECCAVNSMNPPIAGVGVCPAAGLSCPATTRNFCELPAQQISANASTLVSGVCEAGKVPANNAASCNSTCTADSTTASWTSPAVGCVDFGCQPNQVVATCNNTPTCMSPCAVSGQTWNSSCNACECAAPRRELVISGQSQCVLACPSGTEEWNGQCLTPCGQNQVRNSQGACVCAQGFELINGICTSTCGQNQVRDGNGQCVCASGFELWNGQCVAACGQNQVRNGSGQCVCQSGFELWNNQCIPIPPALTAGCVVDTIAQDSFQANGCVGNGWGQGWTTWSVGHECSSAICELMEFTGQWASRFSVQWSGACNSNTSYCNKDSRGGGTARVRVTDNVKGIIVLDRSITAIDSTTECVPTEPACEGGPQ